MMDIKSTDHSEHDLDIREIIRDAIEWIYDEPSGTFTAEILDGGLSPPIPISMLEKVDPRLPAVLVKIVKDHEGRGYAVRRTLEFWANPKPIIAEQHRGTRYVTKIRALYRTQSDDIILVDTTYLEVDQIELQGATASAGVGMRESEVRFAAGPGGVCELFMATELLEEHYPGFESRFSAVESLGLTPVEMAMHVFGAASIADAVALPIIEIESERPQ
jgi:hypothetical protein